VKGRRVALWGAVIVALVAVLVIATRSHTPTLQERADSIDRRIACPVCTGESVAESNTGVSREIRADVVRRLQAGQSSDAIIGYYARTGRQILAPADSGIDLLAWAIPIGAILLALCALGFAFVRWRREPRQVASDADEELVADAPDPAPSPKLSPEMVQELEAEREFLVQSLDDLERERAEGGIDDDTYDTLHSDYTARTAEVLRSLREGKDQRPKKPPVSTTRRALLGVGAVVFATGAAFSLAKASGQRGANDTITGNQGAIPTTTTTVPNTYDGHFQAGERSMLAGDYQTAAQQLLAASKLEPQRVEPYAELGWLLIQTAGSQAQPDQNVVDTASGYLAKAQSLDPTYTDTYLYEGVLHLVLRNDPQGAIPLFERYLKTASKGAAKTAMATQLLQRARSGTQTTTTTNG
jgi:cytochrome c-type biogenesis protein CcmH